MKILANFCGCLRRTLTAAGEQRGTAMIETALVMPVLLLVATGIFSMGQLLNHDLMLTNAVAMGGQQMADFRGQQNITNPCASAISIVNSAAPLLNPASLTYTFNFNGTVYGPYTGTGDTSSCAGTSTTGAPSHLVEYGSAEISVTYPCTVAVFGNANLVPGCILPAEITEFVQ